jgi:hypothetical protein
MSKKIIAACMAIAAFAAFGMASTASAAPVVTQPTGTVLATGTKIVGTNVGETRMVTPLGTVTCSTATLKGTLTTNSTASGSKGEVTSATFAGTGAEVNGEKECTSWTGGVTVTPNHPTSAPVNGLPWCLEATASTDEGKVRGGGCSSPSRAIRFGMDFTTLGTCVYQRTAAAVGEVTTDLNAGEPQDAVVHLKEQEWTLLSEVSTGFGCPASGKLNMSFTLATESGSPVYFSS